jgi:hypothetical protein
MLNIIMSFIIGALVLIIALPLLFLRALRGRFRNPADPARGADRRFSGFRSRSSREGEVTVSGQDATAGEKIIGDHIGEYVDYEEVDDKKK